MQVFTGGNGQTDGLRSPLLRQVSRRVAKRLQSLSSLSRLRQQPFRPVNPLANTVVS